MNTNSKKGEKSSVRRRMRAKLCRYSFNYIGKQISRKLDPTRNDPTRWMCDESGADLSSYTLSLSSSPGLYGRGVTERTQPRRLNTTKHYWTCGLDNCWRGESERDRERESMAAGTLG